MAYTQVAATIEASASISPPFCSQTVTASTTVCSGTTAGTLFYQITVRALNTERGCDWPFDPHLHTGRPDLYNAKPPDQRGTTPAHGNESEDAGSSQNAAATRRKNALGGTASSRRNVERCRGRAFTGKEHSRSFAPGTV